MAARSPRLSRSTLTMSSTWPAARQQRPVRVLAAAVAVLVAAVLLALAAAAPTQYQSAAVATNHNDGTQGNGAWVVPVENGVRMVSKVVGTEFYVRAVNADGSPGAFQPFGFIGGINIGASKPYHDPGELPLTFNDYFRVRRGAAQGGTGRV